jgi:cytochrome b561
MSSTSWARFAKIFDMQNADAKSFRYDDRTIALHWAVAAIVVLLWCLGQTIDWFPRGLPRISARSTHIVLGAALVPLALFRLWWRLSGGRRLPATAQSAAAAGHVLLYVLLLAAIVLGLVNAWVRGDSIFQLFVIPKFDPGNKPLQERCENLHALAVNTLIGVAAVHAALALIHHRVLHDDVLNRMRRAR